MLIYTTLTWLNSCLVFRTVTLVLTKWHLTDSHRCGLGHKGLSRMKSTLYIRFFFYSTDYMYWSCNYKHNTVSCLPCGYCRVCKNMNTFIVCFNTCVWRSAYYFCIYYYLSRNDNKPIISCYLFRHIFIYTEVEILSVVFQDFPLELRQGWIANKKKGVLCKAYHSVVGNFCYFSWIISG